jgi:hypothetical protein
MPSPKSRTVLAIRPTPRRVLRTLVGLLACTVAGSAWAAAPYRGRAASAVIDELATAGHIQLVYTSAVVPAAAAIAVEPAPGPPLAVLDEVLSGMGLRLQQVEGRIYSIVPGRRTGAAAPADSTTTLAAPTVPLAEIVVTASRYSLATDVPDIHVFLSQLELEALPRLAEDALKAVHRLPGAASNGLGGLAHMRGGDQNETLVLLDGLPLYEPFHLRLLQGPSSVLDQRIIAGLDVYAGGFTVEFGDRMSAVIDAHSLRPEAESYYELGLSLMHANALASQRFADGRGQWLASFRRSNLDEVADVLHSDVGEATYHDGFARVDYAWSPATHGSLHMLLANDNATINNSAGTEYADVKYLNSYVWATLSHDWNDRLGSTGLVSFTRVSAQREASVIEPGRRTGIVSDERDYDVLGLKLDGRYETGRWLQRAGIDIRRLDARYDYASTVDFADDFPFPDAPAADVTRRLSPHPTGEHVALYYTVRGRLTDSLTAELGLRWDEQTYGVDADDQFGPRLNLAWRATDRTRLLASWGRYQQFQGIEELQVEDGIDQFFRSASADHSIVGVEYRLTLAHQLRVEAYRKDYRNLPTRHESLYDPLSLAPELRWDRVAITPSSALAEGVELLLTRKSADEWSGWLGYAWARVTDRVDGRGVPRSWDQTHTLNLGLLWSAGPWQATIAAQYHTGWPVTSIGLDAQGNVVQGPRNDRRYSDYSSLDAKLSYEWSLPRGTLTLHGELTNALDRRNPCCTDIEYQTVDGVPALDSELRHWLPLVPSVGVLWKF